jgi:hypothetical protein
MYYTNLHMAYRSVLQCLFVRLRGIFGETCRNAVSGIVSQKDANRNGVPDPYFPGIDIINTPYPTEFCVTMRSGTYLFFFFLEK